MPAPGGHEGIILIADDNEANRELLSAPLSAEGYEVVCAADGQQARQAVDSDEQSCLLTRSSDRTSLTGIGIAASPRIGSRMSRKFTGRQRVPVLWWLPWLSRFAMSGAIRLGF
ncbi:MAG: hypothetical protein DMG49_22790 [Acidobacteria bacterium]|nr:MAG: hypothetical protein DMG49_22790 [Acidobacteriota bacterium]